MFVRYCTCVIVRLTLIIFILQSFLAFIPLMELPTFSVTDVIKIFTALCLVVIVCLLLWFNYGIFIPKLDREVNENININAVSLLKVVIIGVCFYTLIATLPTLIFLIGIYTPSVEAFNYKNKELYILTGHLVKIGLAIFCIIKIDWIVKLLLWNNKI